jgi:primary-amine oxidase
MKLILFFLFFLYMLFCSTIECNNNHIPHPLDPLTPSEFNLVRTIILKLYKTNNLTFHYIGLHEPDKHLIQSWLSSKTKTLQPPPPRQAFIIARFQKQSHEIIIDFSSHSIISTKIYKGQGYPMLTFGEQTIASQLPFSYKPFKDSLKKRGLNISNVLCATFTTGWFGTEITKRTVKVKCYYNNGSANLYVRPLEGFAAVVDLDEMKIISYSDRYVIPVPKAEGTEYRASKMIPPFGPKLKGIGVSQHDGPGFTIQGHSVRYYKIRLYNLK